MKIIYTPFTNLKKTGDMAVGQVAFHNDRKVKRGKCLKRSLVYRAAAREWAEAKAHSELAVTRSTRTAVSV